MEKLVTEAPLFNNIWFLRVPIQILAGAKYIYRFICVKLTKKKLIKVKIQLKSLKLINWK